jgi:serine/threonine-protein kinase
VNPASGSSSLPRAFEPAREASRSVVFWLFPIGGVLILLGTLLGITVTWSRSNSKNPDPPKKEAPAVPEGMIFVAGGEFAMGNDDGDEYERPEHKVVVPPFFIDQHEVTCEQYEKFTRATGHRVPDDWRNGTYPTDARRHPVTGVDWNDANAYAKWAGKRLPSEEEWEYAARGVDRRKYPWGNDWQNNIANAGASSLGHFSDVGSFPAGKSPFGLMDMVGNAWEWTASDLKPYPGGRLTNPPHEERKITRGASWFKDKERDWTTTFRGFAAPAGGNDYSKVGFRCAKDATPSRD